MELNPEPKDQNREDRSRPGPRTLGEASRVKNEVDAVRSDPPAARFLGEKRWVWRWGHDACMESTGAGNPVLRTSQEAINRPQKQSKAVLDKKKTEEAEEAEEAKRKKRKYARTVLRCLHTSLQYLRPTTTSRP